MRGQFVDEFEQNNLYFYVDKAQKEAETLRQIRRVLVKYNICQHEQYKAENTKRTIGI